MFGGENRRRVEKAQGRTVPGVVSPGGYGLQHGNRQRGAKPPRRCVRASQHGASAKWVTQRMGPRKGTRPSASGARAQRFGDWSSGQSPRSWFVPSELRFAKLARWWKTSGSHAFRTYEGRRGMAKPIMPYTSTQIGRRSGELRGR